ncbi:SGNH/GDSL hydrolase family protein [Colwellia demingiae]|uniref:SGNH/GDSL hydrolase family protein n=2 Tax=Colwellia demingiae TaxID=89401 RepID=A0A5C6Q5K4_9GAMM|nr:SGNH/GDSL hydrolase family protein [Colwellia demingiae]
MIGSSIFEFWQQPNWAPLNVCNHAVRGTQSQYWCDRDLSTLPKAKSYLLYCGSNDLIYGVAPKKTVENIKTVLTTLMRLQPTANIGYFSIMACPQKETAGQLEIIDDINQQIKTFIDRDKRLIRKTATSKTTDNQKQIVNLHYFNFNHYIANDEQWFVDDGLHLTEEAYQMLDEQLNAVLSRWATLC